MSSEPHPRPRPLQLLKRQGAGGGLVLAHALVPPSPPTPGLAASPGRLVRWVWQGPGWPQEPLLAPSPRYRNPPAVVTRQPGKPSPPGRAEPGGQQGSFSQWSEARARGELIPEPAAQTGPQATLPHQCWAAAWGGGGHCLTCPCLGQSLPTGSSSRAEGNVQWLRGPRFLPLWPGDGGGSPAQTQSRYFPLPPHHPTPCFSSLSYPPAPIPARALPPPSMHPRTLPPSKAPAWTEALSSLSRTPMLAALSPRLQEQPELGALTSRA
ncbi:unnamed protein product [Eretmochelys imbricata]